MSEFVDNLPEVFALFGAVRARRMFDLVVDDARHLETEEQSVAAFTRPGLPNQ